MDTKHNVHNKMILDWSNIIISDENTTNKGKKFEDLIENLLKAIYGENIWRRTQITNDGKKDFAMPYKDVGNDTHWAECKNYNKRISINTLSPTLVMSAIENVPNIIFFSYSELNRNAYNYLSKFAKAYNKEIQVYSGRLLENIIYKYRNSINDIDLFFPDIFKIDFKNSEQYQEKCKQYNFLRSLDGKRILSDKHKFEIGEQFKYVSIIHNISIDDINFTIDIPPIDKIIHMDSMKFSHTLSAGEILEIDFNCEILYYKPHFMLPNIKFFIDKQENVISNNVKYKIINIAYSFFCGQEYLDALDKIINLLLTDIESLIFVEGVSGSGKSTILRNIQNNNKLYEKYNVIHIDGDEKMNTFVHRIKDILFQIMGAKYFIDDDVDEYEEQFLFSNFYANNPYNHQQVVASIIQIAFIKKILFIIDNVNSLDSQIIRILNNLFIKVKDENLWDKISFVLTVNTGETTHNDIAELLNIDKYFLNIKQEIITLNGFNTEDAIAYFSLKFGLKNISLYFNNNMRYQPLFLDYFFKHMIDKKVIVKDINKNYIVASPLDFKKNIKKLQKSEINIFKHQNKNIMRKYNNISSEILWIIKLLLVIHSINIDDFRSLNDKAINILVEYKILAYENKILSFKHNKLKQYYTEITEYSADDYFHIYNDLSVFERKYKYEKIFCIFASGNTSLFNNHKRILKKFFQEKEDTASPEIKFNICKKMISFIKKNDSSIYVNNIILYIKNNIKGLTKTIGRETIYSFYVDMITVFLDDISLKWISSQNDIAYIMKKFLDLIISTHKNDECEKYFHKFCKKVNEFNGLSNTDKIKWQTHFNNRMAIAIDREQMLNETKNQTFNPYYTTSLNMASQLNDADIRQQIVIDEFNRHLHYIQDLSVEHIQVLSNFYKSEDYRKDLKAIYHIYLTDFMLNKQNHITDIKSLINHSATEDSSFYISKLMILKLYYLIKEDSRYNIDKSINQILKYAYNCQLRQIIYKVTYIKAQYYRHANRDTSETLDLFIQAYHQLINTLTDQISQTRYTYLFRELISYVYTHDEKLARKIVKGNVSNDILRILSNKEPIHITKDRFFMNSYFNFNGINYPTI